MTAADSGYARLPRASGKQSRSVLWNAGGVRVLAAAAVLAISVSACASGLFGPRRAATPAEAIAHCIETTPAAHVLYVDEFSACMERQGWVHASNAG